MNEVMLTPSQVCEILSCTPHTFRLLVNSRELMCYRLNARVLRVRPSDLKAFLDKCFQKNQLASELLAEKIDSK